MKISSDSILAILGPTASGKSDLAIALAKQYDGEIISVDSRQVYRRMDLGTGKVPRDVTGIMNDESRNTKQKRIAQKTDSQFSILNSQFTSDGIPHHLLDVASPKRTYNVTHFVRDARAAIDGIRERGHLPILCGGTGFWAQALLEDSAFPAVRPDTALRKRLGKLSASELFEMLQKKDPRRAATIDPHNTIRLIRALEIIEHLGKVPVSAKSSQLKAISCFILALSPPKELLWSRIEKRLSDRLEQGMLEEIQSLHERDGLSWKRLENFGLEYRWGAIFLQKKITHEEMFAGILADSRHYAKRQLTWLRRFERMGREIHWCASADDAHKKMQGLLALPLERP